MKTVLRALGLFLCLNQIAVAGTLYVSPGGLHIPPFTNWANAAIDIQSAIDAAYPGDLVLVGAGTYSNGGRVVFGQMTNRVVVDKPITVASDLGPASTHIVGFRPTNSPYAGAIRAVYLANGATFVGFTVRNGATIPSGDLTREQSAGGIFCEPNVVVSNCVISGNYAYRDGGGIRGGLIINSSLASNRADYGGAAAYTSLRGCTVTNNASSQTGGGIYSSLAYSCIIANNLASGGGGGAMFSTLFDSVIRGNSTTSYGGGLRESTAYRCDLKNNFAGESGGGSYGGSADACWYEENSANSEGGGGYYTSLGNSVLIFNDANNGGGLYGGTSSNCTIVNNFAFSGGGGTHSATLRNSIIYSNAANSLQANYSGGSFLYSCTTPLPSGAGNFTNAPIFDGAAWILASNSPCIDAGFDYGLISDYTGRERPLDGNNDGLAKIDVGAYEYLSGGADSDGDGLSDASEINVYQTSLVNADTDGDGMFDGWEVSNSQSPLVYNSPSIAPTNITATDGSFANRIRVTWAYLQAIKKYEVWRGQSADTNQAILLVTDVSTNIVEDSNALPSKVYFYWVRSKNDVGVSGLSAADAGLVLSPPTNVIASDGDFTDRVRLTWPDCVGATAYEVWRSLAGNTSSAVSVTTSVSTNTYDYSSSNVTNIQFFWVKAKNASGSSVLSSNDSGFVRISAPTSVSATDGTFENAVRITWSAATGASGYGLWRSTNDNIASAVIVASNLNTNAFTDAGAMPAFVYHYWVTASNALSVSSLSASNSGYWLPTPTGLQASDGIFTDRVRLTWAQAAGATSYEVWRSLTDSTGTISLVASGITTNTYDFSSSNFTNIQYFWVKARDSSGSSVLSTNDSGFVRLSAPTGVSATDGTVDYAVRVSWNSVQGAANYRIWRGTTDNDAAATLLASGITSNTFDDAASSAALTYFYWVTASNALSESSLSASNSGYWLSPPTAVEASDGTYTDRISVTWSLPIGITSVEVWRATTSNLNSATRIADNVVSTSYDDLSVSPGQIRFYWLKSKSAAGSSAFSSSNSGYRGLSPPAAVAASDRASLDSITITWNPASGANSYNVWRSLAPDLGSATLMVSGITTSVHTDLTAFAWRTNFYWVVVVGPSPSMFSIVDAGSRREVDASDSLYGSFVRISWSIPDGATSFEVWRNIVDDSGSATRIADNQTTNTFDDASAFPGQLYYYWVKPKNGPILRFSHSDAGVRSLVSPASVQASNGTSTDGIVVTWSAVGAAASYEVWRSTVNNTNSVILVASNIAINSFTDAPPVQAFVYYYWVRAVSIFSTSGFGASDWGFRRMATPEVVTATDGTPSDRVVVTWQPVLGAVFYEVWRNSVNSTASATLYADFVFDTTYEDSAADVYLPHYYWVKAKNAVSTSDFAMPDSGFAGVDPILDSDYDGIPDVQESYAGTDPYNSNSFLRVVSWTPANVPGGNGYVISWLSQSNRSYRIEVSTNLMFGGFSSLASGINAVPPMNTYTDSNASATSMRIYRIGVE